MDLIETVLAEQIAGLVNRGNELLTATDEFAALSEWLQATLAHALTYRGLSAAVMNSALTSEDNLVSTWHANLFKVGAALLTRARNAGTVAPEANEEDVLRMVGAIAWATQETENSAARANRLLTLLLNGLRSSGQR